MEGLSWETVLPLVIAGIMLVLKHLQGGKYKKHLDAAIQLNRIVYSAVEEAEAKEVKELVSEAIQIANLPLMSELNNVMVPLVDGSRIAPPIKRFWRRFLAGKNLAGVAAHMAANSALAKRLDKD